MNNYVITIARGFGSGGCEVAKKLAKELGVAYYENEILTLASQISGLDEIYFQEVNEKRRNKLFGLLKGTPKHSDPKSEKKEFVSDEKMFSIQKEIIENLANTESCIIVGKCADYILKDYPNVISIYIEAPRDFCRKRIMKKMGVTEETANRSKIGRAHV